MNKEGLYILDGFGLIFRAYYAHIRSPLRYQGKNTSAIFGFFSSLFSLLANYKPRYFAVALDSPGETFRHTMYPAYKANRDVTPEDLTAQIKDIIEMLRKLGIPILMQESFEADDLIATLCKRYSNTIPCYIVSSDKDLLQLVDDTVQQLKPQGTGNFLLMSREEVLEQWKVYPEQMGDFLSLVGDSSDNIPGVKGIGKVSAAKLLNDYSSLEGIYENLDSLKEKQKELLLAGKESAELSKRLVELSLDVPLTLSTLDALRLEYIDLAATSEDFKNNGIRRLLDEYVPKLQQAGLRTNNGAGITESSTESISHTAGEVGGSYQKGDTDTENSEEESGIEELITLAKQSSYRCVQDEHELNAVIQEVRQAKVFAFDTETDSLDEMHAKPTGFSLSTAPGSGYYIPLHGPDGDVFSEALLRAKIRSIVEDNSLRMVCQNAKYDLKVLQNWGIRACNLYFDTMIAAWLLDSDAHSYGMDKLAEQYLSYTPIAYSRIMKDCEVSQFKQVPLNIATFYAAEDADITLKLYQKLAGLLKERKLENILYTLEMPLITTLLDMELAGISLDTDVLNEQAKEITKSITSIQSSIYQLCGHEFNINSPTQLQTVLFEERGLTPLRKIKNGYSTDNTVLQQLKGLDPLPEKVLEYRMLNKLKSSYIDVLPQMKNPQTGKLHTSYIQTGAATGRLASKDPNLQNIPIKSEEGRRIRSAFHASDKHVFVSADYSQIELIVLAHFSKDAGLISAFKEGRDIHEQTASLIFGIDSVTSEQRRIAKSINFGVIYGMSAFRLANELPISRSDATLFIKTYFERYAGVQSFIKDTIEQARKLGYVTTIMDRQRSIPAIHSNNHNLRSMGERIAINTIIQGSAADIIKQAMLAVDKRLKKEVPNAHLVLQIHDELVIECPESKSRAVETLLIEEMVGVDILSLPLQVHTTIGRSWGDL